MQENPHLEPHISFISLICIIACGDGFNVQLGNGRGGGGGGDGQEIFLCIKNCWKLMHNTLHARVVGQQ